MFTKFLFTIFAPLNPPPPNQQNDGFPLEFLLKGPQTELRTLSKNCEQTLQKLRTNRIMNKRAFLNFLAFFVFRFSLLFFCVFLPFPRILGVPRREKPLLFSGFPSLFSKKARVGGSGKTFRYLWRFYSLLFRGFSVGTSCGHSSHASAPARLDPGSSRCT